MIAVVDNSVGGPMLIMRLSNRFGAVNIVKTSFHGGVATSRFMLSDQMPLDSRLDAGSSGQRVYCSRADLWAYMKGGTLDFPGHGNPTDNACIE